MRRMNRIAVALSVAALCAAISSACSSSKEVGLRGDMRDAYSQARTLYGYVWSDELFSSPKSEKKIAEAIERLATDFHQAELDTPVEAFEPGFRIAISSQKDLLRDAALRFREGKKDYAQWRLRGMAGNCIGCHSRYQVPIDFVGDLPPTSTSTPETLLSKGEFLFATRQFDAASNHLYETAELFAKSRAGWQLQFRTLKLWLVIEARIKNRPAESAKLLESALAKADAPDAYRPILDAWAKDLRELSTGKQTRPVTLSDAEKLLAPLGTEPTVAFAEERLVPTLLATSALHEILQKNPAGNERRRGTFLLAKAYAAIPLDLFQPFEQQYEEITIRDFPHTDEALEALKLYERSLEQSLGNSDEPLPEDQTSKLTELRKLASPESRPVLESRNHA